MQLVNMRAIITGGASGIGEATARMMLDRGASHVVILDIDEERARELALEVDGLDAITCDVRDSSAVDTAFDLAVERMGGGLDILVNCAGPVGDEVKQKAMQTHGRQAESDGKLLFSKGTQVSTLELTDDDWAAEFAAVVDNVFYCTRSALRYMIPAGRGAIVSNSSIHGIQGQAGVPHYSAAKAAIDGFTKAVAKEVASHGIRVNSVASGYVRTPTLERLTSPALQEVFAQLAPMGRIGRPDEIAATICYLCSEDSGFMTGQVLSPNGGYVMF